MYTLNRILVPVDFSTHSVDALDHAILLGSRYEAEITLMHVEEFVVSPLGALQADSEFVRAYQRKKEEFLQDQFGVLLQKYQGRPVQLKTRVVPGRAYKVIVEESEKEEYDLIVIATRGLTHLSSHLIGGTAERVVRLSRRPVLSIQHGPTNEGRVHSILCPTDLSPAANIALSYALSIARQNNAVLYIQYVSELDKPESEAEVRKKLPNLHDEHPRAGDVRVEYLFDRDVDPSNAIIRFAEDHEVGMIVMSTHGRKGLRRVYIGNNAAEVVRQSTRPVLTITHPMHKAVFSRPVTEAIPIRVPKGNGQRSGLSPQKK
jgi:nucleotide-binding universal stress UspA family protein